MKIVNVNNLIKFWFWIFNKSYSHSISEIEEVFALLRNNWDVRFFIMSIQEDAE